MKSVDLRFWGVIALTGVCCLVSGCPSRPAESTGKNVAPDVTYDTSPLVSRSPRTRAGQIKARSRREVYSARSGAAGGEIYRYSSEDAVQRVLSIVQDSVRFGPTTIVWLLDISPSAMRWGGEIHGEIRRFYNGVVPQLVADQSDRLDSAVFTVSRRVEKAVERSSDPKDIVRAIDDLRVEESGREVTFQAVQRALREYLHVRIQQRREVMFVIVTDEAGDDWKMVDQLVMEPRKYAIPIYVIGVPAPFGRTAALDATVEPAGSAMRIASESAVAEPWQPILQGPESRSLERIRLRFAGYDEDMQLIDSGFGPFGLEQLCRASGGAFLAVRRNNSREFSFESRRTTWPAPGLETPDPNAMRSYLPDALNGTAYQAQLDSNRACMALHQAAQLPPADVLVNPQLFFVKRSEADLKNRLDRAQQAAAKIAPEVDQVYEILREGVADLDQLNSPRWEAGFELAFGRVCAAKARIDGYNSMLAALKRGKTFENEGSTTWVLQRAETCELSSSLQKLIDRAGTLLERVVDRHPGTPWAKIARRELDEPMGWEWTER